ncbi:MAG: polyketide synthase dehydratase domain-containing protein, partial [Terracidiphilus sp.]
VFSRTSEWVEHCTGTIGPCLSHPAAKAERAAIVARCGGREIVFDAQHRTRQERYLTFGPRWQSLRRLLIGNDEALAEIELDDRFIGDIAEFRMHPALLDLATGASVYLTADHENSEDFFLPVSYRRVRVYRSLPAKLFSHIRAKRQTPHRSEVETFDITLFDEQGLVLAEIEGFSMRRIADPESALAEGAWARDNLHTQGQASIDIPDHAGILPIDGARALIRILSTNSPRAVIAVSNSLGDLDQSSRVTAAQNIGDALPNLEIPNETIEGTLAAWWREMLGVDQVGLDDDFFNLGGHSLVGIRLLAKVRREYQVNLDFGVLFEARTVRQLADAIRKLQSVPAGKQVRDS